MVLSKKKKYRASIVQEFILQITLNVGPVGMEGGMDGE
jgi:hypothetical protein